MFTCCKIFASTNMVFDLERPGFKIGLQTGHQFFTGVIVLRFAALPAEIKH